LLLHLRSNPRPRLRPPFGFIQRKRVVELAAGGTGQGRPASRRTGNVGHLGVILRSAHIGVVAGTFRPVAVALSDGDSYQGYSFVAEVQLQLQDVDRVEVAASVKAGIIDPSAKVQRVTLQDDVAAEGDESLEKPVVEAASESASQQYERPRNASGRFR